MNAPRTLPHYWPPSINAKNIDHLTDGELLDLVASLPSPKLCWNHGWDRGCPGAVAEREHAMRAAPAGFVDVPELGEGPADDRRNLIIEGDNMDALKALRADFTGSVQCIIVDPPYNTGNKSLTYADNRRPSAWLEGLYWRFTFARDLLADDGVIIVFIDEEHVSHVSALLQSIFPVRVGGLVWRTRTSGGKGQHNLSIDHEHVLVFAKNELVPDGRPALSSWLCSSSEKSCTNAMDGVVSATVPMTSGGTRTLQAMLGDGRFSYPKSVEICSILIDRFTKPGDTVLDFYAGSGTSGHAVLALNHRDGLEGSDRRRFVLVCLPEPMSGYPGKQICRDVCAERVRRAATGNWAKGQQKPLGGGFSYVRML